MNYPKIDKKALDKNDKWLFRLWYKEFKKSIKYDRDENEMQLTNKDIEILAWNCATIFTASYVREKRQTLKDCQ